jgi:hypothetical protein
VLCKDRVFERFRSLYTQRPTQSSVLRRRLVFNAEVAEYVCVSRMASRDHNILAQEGIVERIPGLSAHFVIKSPSTDPDSLYYNYRGRNSYSFSTSLFTFFSALFSRRRSVFL